MRSATPIPPARLDLNSVDILLHQLRSGECDDDLCVLRTAGSARLEMYPHWLVLASFSTTPVVEQREKLLEALRLMVAKGAPIEQPASARSFVTGLLNHYWGDTPEVCRALAQMYAEAGLIDVTRPIPGHFGLCEFSGMLPLAAAISTNYPECTELFISLGADLDKIGPVERAGPNCRALEFAYECASRTPCEYHCLPLVLEQSMRRDISRALGMDTASSAPSARRRPSL